MKKTSLFQNTARHFVSAIANIQTVRLDRFVRDYGRTDKLNVSVLYFKTTLYILPLDITS
jgi:hypothetical protein